MAVYVDNAKHKYGRMIMCHMLADSITELWNMAIDVGIDHKYFQLESTPHFDICKSNRELAIKKGALVADRKKVVELIRFYRAKKNIHT